MSRMKRSPPAERYLKSSGSHFVVGIDQARGHEKCDTAKLENDNRNLSLIALTERQLIILHRRSRDVSV